MTTLLIRIKEGAALIAAQRHAQYAVATGRDAELERMFYRVVQNRVDVVTPYDEWKQALGL